MTKLSTPSPLRGTTPILGVELVTKHRASKLSSWRQEGRVTNLERLLSIGYKNNRATHYCVRSIY